MASTVIYGVVAYLIKTQILFDDPGFVGLDAMTYTLFFYGAIAASVFLAILALVILPQPQLRDRIVPRLTVLKARHPRSPVLCLSHPADSGDRSHRHSWVSSSFSQRQLDPFVVVLGRGLGVADSDFPDRTRVRP